MLMKTAMVRGRMPGGVGGQRREPLPTRLAKKKNEIEFKNEYVFEFFDIIGN
jgi:hypothetical protein